MNVQELGEEYRNKTDKELLRLALSSEQLTPEAHVALSAELVSRGINGETNLKVARQEEEEDRAESNRQLGTLGFVLPIGVGRMRFGKANGVYDPESGVERFKTTIFLVLLCFPLIPTGTFLVERKRALPDRLTSLEKLPLDWEQILTVWAAAAAVALGLIWLVKFVSSDAALRFIHRH